MAAGSRVPAWICSVRCTTPLGSLPIVAEDLGEMFDSVRQLLAESGFPGMKVLQFAFTGEDSVDLPHNYPRNCVAYPGTHDNNTLSGWFGEELTLPSARRWRNTSS